MSSHQRFQVRLGQTWTEQDPQLGMRVCVVERIEQDQVLLRTVYDEGLIGTCETSVPLNSLLDRQAGWRFVSEQGQYAQ